MSGNITIDIIKLEKINQYVKCFEISGDHFFCQVKECTSKLTDKSAAIRHLKCKHPEIATAINELKNNQPAEADLIDIRTKSSPIKIWNAILQMIIFGALPFAIVQSSGFRLLVKPFVTAFNRAGIKFAVNVSNLQVNIEEKANEIKRQITHEANGKMVCLQLDIASRFNRSILGVNVSYFHHGKLCIRSVGMHTLKVSQTARNLFEIIKEKMNEFGIAMQQIFAVTTDNGKNLIKLNKIIQKDLSDENNVDCTSDDDSDNEIDCDEENIPSSNPTEYENDEDICFDPEIFNEEYFRDLLWNIRGQFSCSYDELFTGISCAAHGLHLVVTGAIKACPGLAQLVDKCRALSKKLRTPNMRAELKKNGKKMSILDVKTRWSSLYNMVSQILCSSGF